MTGGAGGSAADLAHAPVGTLKCRAGYRHFLMRSFDKLRGELGLMILCYTRVLIIIGLDRLVAWLATRCFLGDVAAGHGQGTRGRPSGLCRKASGFSTIGAAPLGGRTKACAATGFAT
ncbi:MAG: putative transposase [Rhodospirillales bacterium]|nr:putative transposase [Rhodospirillales bacterium]